MQNVHVRGFKKFLHRNFLNPTTPQLLLRVSYEVVGVWGFKKSIYRNFLNPHNLDDHPRSWGCGGCGGLRTNRYIGLIMFLFALKVKSKLFINYHSI